MYEPKLLIYARNYGNKFDIKNSDPHGGHFGRHLEYSKLFKGDNSTPPWISL